ncbi:MAG: hypothetical protein WDO69_11295 [Pseudomonadota bacterium]
MAFHQKNHERAEKIEKRLHLVGTFLFAVTTLLLLVEFSDMAGVKYSMK